MPKIEARGAYETFVGLQKTDKKNLPWFLKHLRTYKLIYRKYVQSLRHLLLRMRRVPLLTETTAASESNMYTSVLNTVNTVEEYTRSIETDFAFIQTAIKAYMGKIAQLKKMYKEIQTNEKRNLKRSRPKKDVRNVENRASYEEWQEEVNEALKMRADVYTKIRVMKLAFDMTKVAGPLPKTNRPNADDITIVMRHLPEQVSDRNTNPVNPVLTENNNKPPLNLNGTYLFPKMDYTEHNYFEGHAHSANIAPLHAGTGIILPSAIVEHSIEQAPTLLEGESNVFDDLAKQD